MRQKSAVQQSGTVRQPAAAGTLLTRGQVAELLGTSIRSVRRPRRRAFMRFSKGLTPREVVIELRQPPDVIQTLHRQWREAGGLWLPRTFMATIRKSIAASYPKLRDIRIDTPDDLVAAVQRVLSDLDDSRETLWERADEIADLEQEKQALREKRARRRAELADWADWAARQEAAATAPSKADG